MACATSNTGENRHRGSSESDKRCFDLRYHKDEIIMKPDQLEKELRNFPEVRGDILNRIHGSMAGLALGDALGACVEFRPRDFMKNNPMSTLKGGGTWGLEKGQFTDDTSMALCLANSLIVCRDFIPYDQLVRYKWWHRYGYMSSTGKCFDIGKATKESLEQFERRQNDFQREHNIPIDDIDYLFIKHRALVREFDTECSTTGVAGNGALMRLAPVPLFFYRHPSHAVEFSGISGRITHGDKIAYDACRYYGALIVAALRGESKERLLSKRFYSEHKPWFGNEPLHENIMEIDGGSYQNLAGHTGGIRGKGYIVKSLEAALWAFWSDKRSFRNGVLAAINLGDDTDTTAAIYGQLAGAYYGYNELPKDWREALYARRFIEYVSGWIVYQGERWRPEKSMALNRVRSTQQEPSTPTVVRSDRPKPNSNGQPAHPHSKASSEKGSTSASKPHPAHDQNPKPNNKSTQHKSSNPPQSSQNPSKPERGSVLDNPAKLSSSAGSRPAAPPRYMFDGRAFATMEDVCNWFKRFNDGTEKYVLNFKKHGIDLNQLLSETDDKNLTQCGIEDERARKTVMSHLSDLKGQLSVKQMFEGNDG